MENKIYPLNVGPEGRSLAPKKPSNKKPTFKEWVKERKGMVIAVCAICVVSLGVVAYMMGLGTTLKGFMGYDENTGLFGETETQTQPRVEEEETEYEWVMIGPIEGGEKYCQDAGNISITKTGNNFKITYANTSGEETKINAIMYEDSAVISDTGEGDTLWESEPKVAKNNRTVTVEVNKSEIGNGNLEPGKTYIMEVLIRPVDYKNRNDEADSFSYYCKRSKEFAIPLDLYIPNSEMVPLNFPLETLEDTEDTINNTGSSSTGPGSIILPNSNNFDMVYNTLDTLDTAVIGLGETIINPATVNNSNIPDVLTDPNLADILENTGANMLGETIAETEGTLVAAVENYPTLEDPFADEDEEQPENEPPVLELEEEEEDEEEEEEETTTPPPPALELEEEDDDTESTPPPPPTEICNNGKDDDGDGKIDYEDTKDCKVPSGAKVDVYEDGVSKPKFNPEVNSVKVYYKLDHDADVVVEILDSKGKTVVELLDEKQDKKSGLYSVWWEGTKDNKSNGQKVPDGTYTYKITATHPDYPTVQDSEEGPVTVDSNFFEGTGDFEDLNGGGVQPEQGTLVTTQTPTQIVAAQTLQNATTGTTAGTGPGVLIYFLFPAVALAYQRIKN